MPDVTALFNFDSMSPNDLMLHRDALRSRILTHPDGPEKCPIEWLHELSALTGTLRRRTSGPPKAAKRTSKGEAASPKAVLDLI